MRKVFRPIYLIAIPTAMLAWLLSTSDQNPLTQSDTQETTGSSISSIIKGGVFKQYHESGYLAAEIASTVATHYTDNNTIKFEQPNIHLNTDQKESIRITSDVALYDTDAQKLTLTGNVILSQDKYPNPEYSQKVEEEKKAAQQVNFRSAHTDSPTILILETTALEYDRKGSFISTDQAVTISRDTAKIHATGLKAWLDEKKMTLLSKVRGRYEPSN